VVDGEVQATGKSATTNGFNWSDNRGRNDLLAFGKQYYKRRY
jgi:hypothetical protein